ncbi:MAG: hypothetical protein ACM31O_11180 [Bacteroidota bacterium]|jgi:hypothetical protein
MRGVVDCKYSLVLSVWQRVVGDRVQWSSDKDTAFRGLLHLAVDRIGAKLRMGEPVESSFSIDLDGSVLSCLVGRRGQIYDIIAISFCHQCAAPPASIDPGALLHEARQTLAVLAVYWQGRALVIEVVKGDALNRRRPRLTHEARPGPRSAFRKVDIIC